jgi:hypothetical protein
MSAGRCETCGKTGNHMKTCAKCHVTNYCSRECQISNWPVHKVNCGKEVQSELRGSDGIRCAIPCNYKISPPIVENLFQDYDIRGIDLIKKEMSNNDPSMIPMIVKLPFDLRMIDKDEEIAIDFLGELLGIFYMKSDEDLHPYDKDLYEFVRKMMTCQYSREHDGFGEYLFENMLVVTSEFYKQGLRSDTLTKLLMQYWRRETEVHGLANCLLVMNVSAPEEMMSYCISLVSDKLRNPINENPYIIAEIISFLVFHKAMDSIDLIRDAYAKNSVSMGEIGGFSTILKKLGVTPTKSDTDLIEKYKKWD